MQTNTGRFLKDFRLNAKETVRCAAEKLHVSAAFLSAVENGQKKMPRIWLEKIPLAYKLSDVQADEFRTAFYLDEPVIRLDISHADPLHRELAITFAKHFSSLDEKTGNAIQKMLTEK